MSDWIMLKFNGFNIEVEYDGFEDKQYGNHWEVTRIVIEGCAAEQLLDDSVRRRVEEALHNAVN